MSDRPVDIMGKPFQNRMSQPESAELARIIRDGAVPITDGIQPIRLADDFPKADHTGKRQLESGVLYTIYGDVDLGATWLELGVNTALVGVSAGPSSLRNSRNDYLVKGTGVVRNVNLTCPLGTALTIDQPGLAVVANASFTACARTINVVNVTTLSIDRVVSATNVTGIEITGACVSGQIGQVLSANNQGSYTAFSVTATATVGPITTSTCQITLTQPSQVAFHNDASATYTDQVHYIDNVTAVSGGAQVLTGLPKTDPRVIVRHTTGVQDSLFNGTAGYSGNTTQNTVITSSGVFVNIGTGNPSHPPLALVTTTERFSLVGTLPDQELQYDGLETIVACVTYSMSVVKASASAIHFHARALLDSVELPGSFTATDIGNNVVAVTQTTTTTLTTGQRLRLQVTNDTDTTDVRVEGLQLTAFRV